MERRIPMRIAPYTIQDPVGVEVVLPALRLRLDQSSLGLRPALVLASVVFADEGDRNLALLDSPVEQLPETLNGSRPIPPGAELGNCEGIQPAVEAQLR